MPPDFTQPGSDPAQRPPVPANRQEFRQSISARSPITQLDCGKDFTMGVSVRRGTRRKPGPAVFFALYQLAVRLIRRRFAGIRCNPPNECDKFFIELSRSWSSRKKGNGFVATVNVQRRLFCADAQPRALIQPASSQAEFQGDPGSAGRVAGNPNDFSDLRIGPTQPIRCPGSRRFGLTYTESSPRPPANYRAAVQRAVRRARQFANALGCGECALQFDLLYRKWRYKPRQKLIEVTVVYEVKCRIPQAEEGGGD